MMNTFLKLIKCAVIFGVITAVWSSPLSAYEISSYAHVNDDATLQIKGKTVYLYGIHIPDSGQTCSRNRTPPVCGSRAVIALDFKIDGFVRCEIIDRYRDGSLVGWCRVKASSFSDGEDLSAYLLQKGWAVALPGASIEYQTLEKIARSRQFGVWGMSVDSIGARP
jgi:endonuclease YncB( thermonuclease family)